MGESGSFKARIPLTKPVRRILMPQLLELGLIQFAVSPPLRIDPATYEVGFIFALCFARGLGEFLRCGNEVAD